MIWVTMLDDLTPILVQSVSAILAALTPFIAAWLRARTRRLVVEQAATEAEAAGHRDGLSGAQKKQLAITLSGERLGLFTSMSEAEIDAMVEGALPQARTSARPPPGA